MYVYNMLYVCIDYYSAITLVVELEGQNAIGRKSTHDSCALFPSAPKNQKIFRAEIIDNDNVRQIIF
jgi:hypothetical protein